MNVRTATLLSIAGVLAAGTAAVAVNTQVLSGSAAPAEVPSALSLPVSTQVFAVPSPTVAQVVGDTDGNVGAQGRAASTEPVGAGASLLSNPPITATPGVESPSIESPTVMAFRIGEAAVATVDTSGGVLTIREVVPASGWKIVAASGSGTVRLEFELESATTRVAFGAFLSGGEILTSVSAESLSSSTNTDDDDHDDDHDDEYDDEYDDDRGDDDD